MDFNCMHDRAAIERFLRLDAALHIYSLGDLDDFLWPYTMWFGRAPRGELEAIALLYAGMPVPTLLALAREPDAVRALLESIRHLLPARFYAHLSPGLSPVLEAAYRVTFSGVHLKMALEPGSLRGHSRDQAVAGVGANDLPELLAFYQEAYPGNWFDPRMLETGRYVGVREHGRLVSIAGIHVYSPRYRVAALGNIATLPAYRGRGYGSRATAHLCRMLVDEGVVVGLNVKADNDAAITVYRRIGFEPVARYEEYEIERR